MRAVPEPCSLRQPLPSGLPPSRALPEAPGTRKQSCGAGSLSCKLCRPSGGGQCPPFKGRRLTGPERETGGSAGNCRIAAEPVPAGCPVHPCLRCPGWDPCSRQWCVHGEPSPLAQRNPAVTKSQYSNLNPVSISRMKRGSVCSQQRERGLQDKSQLAGSRRLGGWG